MFNPIPSHASSLPEVTSSNATTASGSSSPPTASNELNANSFITLLTTQLQAQDPLNPLDPNQMVNELTTMNTLQELIQIRQDMDTLVGAAKVSPSDGAGSSSGSGSGSAPGSGSTNAASGAVVRNAAASSSAAGDAAPSVLPTKLSQLLSLSSSHSKTL